MTTSRAYAAGTQITNNLWWITGGGSTTELYNATDEQFYPYVDLPKSMSKHNIININVTHTVLLGGSASTDEVYVFNQ